jgi:hypothetical protein
MSKCNGKICPADKVCNPSSGRCVKRSGKLGKNIQSRSRSRSRSKNASPKNEENIQDFMMKQTVVGLKSYIISRDKNKVLKGWKSLKKKDLVQFILKHIDVETGKIKSL